MNEKEIKDKYYDFLKKARETMNPRIQKYFIREAATILRQLEKEGRKIKGINCSNY